MNKRYENKLTMYEGLLALLQSNIAKFQSIGGVADAVTELSVIVTGLKAKSTEWILLLLGKPQPNTVRKIRSWQALLPACSALYIFGRKQNNAEIKERANVTEAKLRAMRDTELASFGNAVAELSTANVQGVVPFGITAGKNC